MAADDKESDERHQSHSLERDRGKRRRRHRSDSPSPNRRRKRSYSPGPEEKHRHNDSAEKHGDNKDHELRNRNTEAMSEDDNGKKVTGKIGLQGYEKEGSRKSSKEDRKAELHSSGDSSEDPYLDSESGGGRTKKSRSKHHKSQKSKSTHHLHVHLESEQDESQTEGTSGESSEDSEDEYMRAKRRKRLKQKEKTERKRKEERRRKKKVDCVKCVRIGLICLLLALPLYSSLFLPFILFFATISAMKRKMKEKEREQEKRKKRKEEKRAEGSITDDVGDCSEGDNMHGEGSNDDLVLDPKHKIFLSHSGAQKEFVEHLCKGLEDRLHYPFFDRRHESLPKGERFPELIVQAAEQCEMLIVVVSNEYFMSKWPMIELSAFVKAHKLHWGSNMGPKILPLFYGLSVSDLDNERMRKKWFQQWKTLAEADPKKRIVVRDWKNALDVLKSFNGLSYDRTLKEVIAYVDKIVSHVCKSIAPDIKWDDSHVQGKSSILKVIGEKIEGTRISQKYKVKVVGIYGVGGIGKTTTCKTLCNEFLSKYEGRVCHIEFPSVPLSDSKELFRKVLRDLTKKSMEVIQQLNEGECKDILRKSLFKQRTFLAIDNIADNHQSIQHAKSFLEFPYHTKSLVIVTARSLGALELLGLDRDACLEMPDLGEVDAMKLFLHHAMGGKQYFEDGEKDDVMTCVRRCYFSKGNGKGHHYHPLALQSLGLQLGCYGGNPSLWVKHLPQVKTFNFFPGENPVFDILRSSFDLLPPKDQALFMDVGCFSEVYYFWNPTLRIEWLCVVHNQKEEEIAHRLEHLKRKGLLQDVDLRSGRISMHDLYLEFVYLEAKGSFNGSTNLRERMWMYLKNGDLSELERKPEGGCWHNLIRLSIRGSPFDLKEHDQVVDWIESIEGMKWDYFSNVEVLQLSGLHLRHGALNVEGLPCLRILELHDNKIDRVEGLENLKHLTYFKWDSFSSFTEVSIVGQFPSSLKRLLLFQVQVVLSSDVLARCYNLSELELYGVKAHTLDLSNCRSLRTVHLKKIPNLQFLLGLAVNQPSNLQSLQISYCRDLIDVPGIDHLINLKKLHISDCDRWEVPSLCAPTKLKASSILGEQRVMVYGKDCFPHHLQELHWSLGPFSSRFNEVWNLIGFNQLEVLNLSGRRGLTSLVELGDLPTLQCLNLQYCEYLLRLPDLRSSRNLKELNLDSCSTLELHEEDIKMLCELPLLQPVPFSSNDECGKFSLNLARNKVIVVTSVPIFVRIRPLDWKVDEWEERDLGPPPIKIGRRGIWELESSG